MNPPGGDGFNSNAFLTVRETMDTTVCESCGVGSRYIDAVRAYRKSFSTRHVFRCDACQTRNVRRWQARYEMTSWGVALLLAGMGLFIPGEVGRWGALLLGVAVGSTVGLVLHEFAHAATAWAVGARVWRIELGVGRRWWTGIVRGVRINVRRLPTMGMVVPQIRGARFRAMRFAIIVIAGPLINGALAFAAIVAASIPEWPSASQLENFAYGVFGANVMMFIGNLWPRTFGSDGVVFRTDGGQLLDLLWPSRRRAFFATITATELIERLTREQFAEVLRLCEMASAERLSEIEPAGSAETIRMVALTGMGRFAEAADLADAMVRRGGLELPVQLTCENNAVYAGLLDGRTDRLTEYVDRSRAVFEAYPSASPMAGTHSMALLLSGRLDEAEAMLDRARALDEDERFVSVGLAWRAVLAARRCDAAGAAAHASEALAVAGAREPEVRAALRYANDISE